MIRKAKAVWRGTGRDGTGDLTTDSGVLSKAAYSFKTRFEGEKGTNPEELIAAAHAGCFTMALAFELQTAGFTPTSLSTEAAVSLDRDGAGFRISKSALTLVADVPGLDAATFDRLAEAAKKDCPVSRLLNTEITLVKTLREAPGSGGFKVRRSERVTTDDEELRAIEDEVRQHNRKND